MATSDEQRAAFETWYVERFDVVHRPLQREHDSMGCYASDDAQFAWTAWQARAALASSPSQPAVLQLAELMRGLELGPELANADPAILFHIGRAIAAQAKRAAAPALGEGER